MKFWIASVALIIFSGCGLEKHEPRDLTAHFWRYVGGDYYNGGNGYFISLDPSTRTAEWYKPLNTSAPTTTPVCYLGANGVITSITNRLPRLFSSPEATLYARVESLNWRLVYTKAGVSPEERSQCEAMDRANTGVIVTPLFIPVIAYGPNVLELGRPQVCFFGCQDVQASSGPQDFASNAPGVYGRARRPF